jgi:signal transduction histidine kinase
LAGHLLRLDVLAGRVRDLPDATADVERLRNDLRGTVSEIRRVVEGLRPPALDELGLVPALQQVAQRMSGGSSVTIDVSASELPPLSAAVEVAAFRIVSEAVTNVVKHAGARCCRVELRAAHGCLAITVADDGRSAGGGLPAVGHGLQTMRERAEELRGTLTVSSDAHGTRVIAQLPLPPEPRRAVPAPAVEATT